MRHLRVVLLVVCVSVSACGGDDGGDADPDATATADAAVSDAIATADASLFDAIATADASPFDAIATADAPLPDATATTDASLFDAIATTDASALDASLAPQTLVINEVDYDQPGTDTLEFIELYNSGANPVALTGLSVVLINGVDNNEYRRFDLSGTLDADSYAVIILPAATLPPGTLRFDAPDLAVGFIQNGSPDGIALVNTSTETVLDALSYEGGITMANIVGFAATVNLVEGTMVSDFDSGSIDGSLSRIPNGLDTADADTDWSFTTTLTPGAANILTN